MWTSVALSLLLAQGPQAPAEPPLHLGPCGLHDVGELGKHFRVSVNTRPEAKNVMVTITTEEAGPNDKRRPLPFRKMSLSLLDATGGGSLKTPLRWVPAKGTVGGEVHTARFIVDPKVAERVILSTMSMDPILDPSVPTVIVSFESLSD